MAEFVSEPITPLKGGFDTAAMARGEPGLPVGFCWRDADYHILQVVETWKHSSREGSRAQGDLYLRRHYYRLLMRDGATWTVYFTRQSRPGSKPTSPRWFLYTIEPPPSRKNTASD